MDTSESEDNYESADEHFDSLEDLHKSVKREEANAHKLDRSGPIDKKITKKSAKNPTVTCIGYVVLTDYPNDKEQKESERTLRRNDSNDNKSDSQGSKNTVVDEENNLCDVSKDIKLPVELEKVGTKNISAPLCKSATRPEYGIPPLITQCWEPGMQNRPKEEDVSAVKVIKKGTEDEPNENSSSDATTALIEECWEPGMNFTPDEMLVVKNEKMFKNDEGKHGHDPEKKIGDNSLTEVYWDPGMNYDFEKLKQPTSPVSKVQNKTTVDDLWNEDEGWGFNEEVLHDTSSKKTEDSSTDSKVLKTLGQEDNWKDEAAWNIDGKQSLNKSKDTTTPLAADEDMWGDDDGWGFNDNFECKSEQASIVKEDVPKNIEKVNQQENDRVTSALDNLSLKTESDNSSWGSWGNWGISSVLSTAANITTSVSQGLTTVIGVPDPEQLAREHKAEREKRRDDDPIDEPEIDTNTSTFGLGNFVSGVSTITKLVETTGTKVISGGLDTLETIGKKTMKVLQENDPGLKKKYAFLTMEHDKPVLSQMLREAKEKAEQDNREQTKLHCKKKANYETIFDDHQGLVHLEALEMLSKQCEIKLQSVMGKRTQESLSEFQETMEQVKELCELPDEDEDETITLAEINEKIDAAVEDIKIPIAYNKLISRWEDMEKWIGGNDATIRDKNDIHYYAIETLAELTALSVEQFHKAGELLLVKQHRSTADEADSLVQLTTTLTALIGIAASKFSENLNSMVEHVSSKEEINTLITNIFFEAANSSRYIQDAFQLLIPVLQVGAI